MAIQSKRPKSAVMESCGCGKRRRSDKDNPATARKRFGARLASGFFIDPALKQ
ncbi:MAG: hypothetical protein MO853_04345 [Candidatus Protistobacter heckmanni]|nr:hypothetical protein [Candidatus Protistobacter heckmanni]